MLSHYSYEGSTPTWTPVDENDESADQWRRTKLESLETHELVNFLRCELKLSRDLISVLYNQISSYDAAYKEMQEKILLITESFEKKEKDLEKKIISLQNSPGKTAMMNSDNISTSLNKMITIKKLNFTIREQTKLLSIYEANIADMLQEIDELCHDTTSKAVQAEQIAMSLEDCKCSIIQLVERLHNETRELQKLREDSANAAKMTAMKVKDINLKVFNAISERNHWKKKADSLSKEFHKSLVVNMSLKEELLKLRRRHEEAIQERKAFKEALILACGGGDCAVSTLKRPPPSSAAASISSRSGGIGTGSGKKRVYWFTNTRSIDL